MFSWWKSTQDSLSWRGQNSLSRLKDGYRIFRRSQWPAYHRWYEALAMNGQRPRVLMITCSDSRISPSTVFGVQAGELFVVRNFGGMIPPGSVDGGAESVMATVEFAVKVLEVANIVVMGHARCACVQALVAPKHSLPPTNYLWRWVELAATARALIPGDFATLLPNDQRQAIEFALVKNSIKNLAQTPWIGERVMAGVLKLHGWHFDFESARLMELDHEGDEWVDVE